MAFVHQESRFVAKAKPPRRKILGFIPGPRPSDAYGYSQALQSTWDAYKRSAGRYGADRDDFGDAIHFVGWYNHQSWKRNGIDRHDAYASTSPITRVTAATPAQTYRDKDWLLAVARKVNALAALRPQLALPSGAGGSSAAGSTGFDYDVPVSFSGPNVIFVSHAAATCACPEQQPEISHERAHRTGGRRRGRYPRHAAHGPGDRGFRCLEADNIQDAHALIVDQRPDIVLLDWMLPGGSGIELLRRLKRDDATSECP
jgi:hypothetical protein